MTRNLLEVDELSVTELARVLDLAETTPAPAVLDRRGVALVFEKPSNRTRNSSEMAVIQLGGHPVSIRGEEVGVGQRETIEDATRTLACFHSVIGARVFDHATLEKMVAALQRQQMPVPVVNLLSDLAHPCQALADLLTLRQSFGSLEGLTVAYVGDANNVCRSLTLAAALAGIRMRVASPAGFGLDETTVESVTSLGGDVELTSEPSEAVAGADAIYTDVWASMGQEEEKGLRRKAFAGFTVDEALVSLAAPRAVVLHCLPAHRGEEITDEVIEGPRSVVWRQAENRMHAMRGLLWWLTAEAGR